MNRPRSCQLRQTTFRSNVLNATTVTVAMALTVGFCAGPALAQFTNGTMTCSLSSNTASPRTSVTLDLFLEDAVDVRGYQATIQITRTSGSGEVTVPCPGGVWADDQRPDFIFPDFDSENLEPDCPDCGIVAPHCDGQRVAVARVTGGVDVADGPANLATFTLDVSPEAAPGSTFEISIVPFPASILGGSDKTSIPFEIGPPCELTISDGGQVCRNNIREGTEECDGTDDDACPGFCDSDCTCPKIPTVSHWGLAILALLLLAAAKIYFGRRGRKTTGSGAFLLFALVLVLASTGAASAGNDCKDVDDLGVLPAGGGAIVGSTIGSTDDFVAGCGALAGGQDQIFEFGIARCGVWTFDTCTVPACWDTNLEIREETGGGCPGDFVACDRDGCNVCYYESAVSAFLSVGTTYYLIVDGWSTFAYGDFTITATLTDPCCTTDADCDDGLFCNGRETCDTAPGICVSGTVPCAPGQACVEETQSCVGCEDHGDCNDGNVCTFDQCIDGLCSNTPTLYGDVTSPDDVCIADGAVTKDDVLFVGSVFSDDLPLDCPPERADIKSSNACEPDGRVDTFDILAVLDAFAGTPNCPCATSPKEVPVYSDPVEQTPYDVRSTGAGYGRAPEVDHLGDVTDSPTVVAGTVSNVGKTIADPNVSHPDGETVPGEDVPPPRPEPAKKECVPPSGPTQAALNAALNFKLPRGLGGALRTGSGAVNALDLGAGIGWNYSTAVLIEDPLNGRFILVGRDSGITTFEPDGAGGFTSSAGGFYTLTVNPSFATVVYKNGTTYQFQQMTPAVPLPGTPYLLQSITDPNGNGTSYQYAFGMLVSMIDSEGRQITLTHHPDGHIASMTDDVGRTYSYEYTGDNLTGIVLPDGDRIDYSYDAQDRLTSKTVPTGETYTIQYGPNSTTLLDDALNTVVSVNGTAQIDEVTSQATGVLTYVAGSAAVTDGDGNAWTYDYDSLGRITRVVTPDLSEIVLGYDPVTRKIASVQDCNLHTTTYEYDLVGNLTQVTDAVGNITTMEYDPAFNNLTRRVEPDGDEWLFNHEASGNLIEIVDPIVELPVDRTITYAYDLMGNRTLAVDRNGNATTFAYTSGLVTSKTVDPSGLGLTSTYEYDSMGRLTRMTNQRGIDTDLVYDAYNRITQQTVDPTGLILVTTQAYDANGNLVSATDARGTVTEYVYDLRGRVVQQTRDVGLGRLNIVTGFAYDGRDNKIVETDDLDNTTTFEYDALNRVTRIVDRESNFTDFQYDCAGNQILEVDGDGRSTQFDYDALDRLVTQTDDPGGLNLISTFDYTATPCGCGTPGNDLVHKTTDPDGRVTYRYYDALDRIVRIVGKVNDTLDNEGDADDAITTAEYDSNGNATRVTVFNAPNPDQVAEFTFDAANRQISRTLDPGAAALTTTYEYDGMHNVTRQVEVNGNDVTFGYDAVNRLTLITDSIGLAAVNAYDANGNSTSRTDPNGNSLSFEYDALNRLTKQFDGNGNFILHAYDRLDRRVSTTDRKSRVTTFQYDNEGRLMSVIRPQTAPLPTTQYTYDASGRRATQLDSNAGITAYTYDDIGRLTQQTFPDGAGRVYAYDGRGNLTQRTDGNMDVTTYAFDDLNRLTLRSYVKGAGSPAEETEDNTFVYDRAGNMISADNVNADLDFTYDGVGRVASSTQNGVTTGFSYSFPGAGSVRQTTYPGGRQVFHTHDVREQISQVADGGSILSSFIFDLAGRMSSRSHTNGTSTTYSMDDNAWITSIVHNNLGGPFVDREYGRDVEGNPTYILIKEDLPNSELYSHDDVDRLGRFDRGTLDPTHTTIIAPGTIGGALQIQQFTDLDPVGNWREQFQQIDGVGTTETRGVNSSNQYTNIGSRVQIHDGNGNVLEDGALIQYTFDIENRLVRVEQNSVEQAQYIYDALGRRIAQVTGAALTTYLYDDQRRVIEERDQTNTVQATYVYGDHIDEPLTMDRDGVRFYYHRDALGSIVALTNGAGDPAERYSYDPYGRPFVFDGTGTPLGGSALGNPYMFTGRRYDEQTGLYFYRARTYDPARGRFLQRDPLEYLDSDNLYEYVSSRPTMLTDPLGLSGSGQTCISKTISKKFKKSGKIGPISWKLSFSISGTAKACTKCCPEGTPKACTWVIDNILQLTLKASASASGSSYGGSVGPIGFWAGIRIRVRASGSAAGTFASDRCNGLEVTGKLCFRASGSLSISGGAQAWVSTWFGKIKLGADITGTGNINANKCLFCTSSGCKWLPGKLCISGKVKITVNAFVVSGTWTLWRGKKCWPI